MHLRTLRPANEEELSSLIRDAAAEGRPLEIIGRGTKRSVGRPLQTETLLTTEAMTGVTLYEPTELVLSARAGTQLSEIEQTLAEHNQELAFEPVDLGDSLGAAPSAGSIGGIFATNISGSRRFLAGAARDHLLGVRGVNGRGEIFKSGGRVMKNVTGYDIARGLSGSWGTLAVMTEVTMKVLPRAEESFTLVLRGLTDDVAVEALATAVASPCEVSGAVHLQAALVRNLDADDARGEPQSLTAIRLESFHSSLRARANRVRHILGAYSGVTDFGGRRSAAFWSSIRRLSFLSQGNCPIWRIVAPPASTSKIVASVARHIDCRAAYDWAGGVVWLETAPLVHAGAVEIRRAVYEHGGHATLIRGEQATRASVDVFQPLDQTLRRLTCGLKEAFDPERILNPGRMYAGV